MQTNIYPGIFIVFEGLDGSGQSTQAELLRHYFEDNKDLVILTKEPTEDSKSGRMIRKVLTKEEKIEPDELQKLFVQDRKEHLNNLIIPNLKNGKFVISDRYFLSTCAFGGINLDMEWLIELNDKFILPNITFLLNVDPRICIERIDKRGKRFEFFEEEKKLTKVRENYFKLAKRFPNIYTINGELSKEAVFKEILNKFKK